MTRADTEVATGPDPTVAIVLKGYPRLSETFIAQEIAGIERAGLHAHLYSMRFPTDRTRHPVHDEIRASVSYLPEYLWREPLRVARSWLKVRRLPGYRAARSRFFADWWRDLTPNRARRFGQALVLAAEMPATITHIYAHFLHTPSSVADYAACMRAIPWSFSAHAKDIWLTPDWEKRGKLDRAAWGVTCTGYGHRHLAGLAPEGEAGKVGLLYHGLDLDRFPPPPSRTAGLDGTDPARPVTIASVGRAVEKKGYDVLIDALALLPRDLAWRFVHIGGGNGRNSLRRRAERAGIAGRIEWRGAQAQGAVVTLLREADIFVLASRVARDGDRDGLPNVLMEAQSQALACVATNVSAIPEFITDGETGLLVSQEDPLALAEAVLRLARDPALRARFGAAGRDRLVAGFSFDTCLAGLLPRFGLTAPAGRGLAAAE